MKELNEKVSYLQGLADGLEIDADSKQGRLISEIIGVLGEFADHIENLKTAHHDLEDYVESIDEDLYDLEDELTDEQVRFDEDDLDDVEYVDVECPKCQEVVCFEADVLDDEDTIEVTCPNCNEVVFVNDEDVLENNRAVGAHEDI
ncbi:MAG: AraC family transcriptional regulator [Clostridia bacterium]|nr:AraC family transcriptional regulator [Clostridia bacterium]